MGYLDRQSRVVDFVLTERGRELYAIGQLDFEYFSLMDDGMDYDPWSTGSLTDYEREVQIDALPMLEAPFVRDVRAATAPLEPTDHLFTAAGGYGLVPHLSSPPDGSEVTLACDQRVTNGVYHRSATSVATIDLTLVGDVEPVNPGYVVRVFASGSNGLSALDLRRDLAGRRSFDPFIAVSIDGEVPVDVAKANAKPRSQTDVTVSRKK